MDSDVELGDASTWPPSVASAVADMAASCRGKTTYMPDLPLSFEGEEEFLALFQGHLLRAYHATRLLPHERRMIEAQGLRTLSPTLVSDRIDAAHANGFLTDGERQALHESHVFAAGKAAHREKRVCLVLGRRMLSDDAHGLERLLTIWGGEGIYMGPAAKYRERLRQLGRPAIVVARLDLGAAAEAGHHRFFPEIRKLFVGEYLKLRRRGGEIHYRASVPPTGIAHIWQPGDAEYDRHRDLPRS